ISRSNWKPESAEVRPLFKAPSWGWFVVPRGTGLQLMQFNNPASTKMKTKNMTTLHLGKSVNRSPLRRGFTVVLLALALALFAPSRTAQAQLPSPSPDGGYPNGNTAEGDGA